MTYFAEAHSAWARGPTPVVLQLPSLDAPRRVRHASPVTAMYSGEAMLGLAQVCPPPARAPPGSAAC